MAQFKFFSAARDLFAAVTMEEGLAVVASRPVRERVFNTFIRATVRDTEAMASSILRRWRLPPEVTLDDLVQEIQSAIWKHMTLFDPTLGTSYGEYLRFHSFGAGKRFAHKSRYAILHHNPGVNKSRLPLHLEDFKSRIDGSGASGEHPAIPQLTFQPDQEKAYEEKTANDTVMKTLRTEAEYLIFAAWRDSNGDVGEAADTLMADAMVRRKLRIWSTSDARRAIVKSVRDIAERVNVDATAITS